MTASQSADREMRRERLGTEDNEYLHKFFIMLNSSKDTFETACIQVHIPETIVLNMGIIVGWYFTSKKDGYVRRKKRVNTTKENVASMLHANLKKNMKTLGLSGTVIPVATVTYNATDSDGLKIQNVLHLMENEVDDFLRNTPIKNCLVQQWIHPCRNHNSVLHCLWTPSGVQISRRNARNLLDDRAPAIYRLATYESGAILPADISLCTSTTKQIIKNTCNSIAEHLSTIKVPPASMTTYWKISSDLRVVLLWCSQFTKVGERKKMHASVSVSPTIHLSNPETETQISLPICPFCKNIAGIEGSSTQRRNHCIKTETNAASSLFGDCEIKSITYGTIYDFCLKRELKKQDADCVISNYQWKIIPREFQSLQLGCNLKQFNIESSKPDFRQRSVSVCERCFSKFTLFETEIRVAEMQSKLRDFGNPAFAILPPTFCSSYTVEAYENHFDRLRGSDTTNPKIKLAIKELSRVWSDDTNDVRPADVFFQAKFMETSGKIYLPTKPQKLGTGTFANENYGYPFSFAHRQAACKIPSDGSDLLAKIEEAEANAADFRLDGTILQKLPANSVWKQDAESGFRYNLFDTLPDLQKMFESACVSCKRTTNEQRLRGFSLNMAEWLNFCKNMELCILMPLKTSHCIAAFIYANKWSLDPDQNQMNLDEFGSAIIFLASKANVLVINEQQMVFDGKSCSGVILAGVKRFLVGIGAQNSAKSKPKFIGSETDNVQAKNYADVAELDMMFDASNYDEDILSTFELWQAIPTIPRMFARAAASDNSVLANMGDRSASVSMQEWMKLCDDLGVVKNLPLKRSDCVIAYIDAVGGKKTSAAHQEMNLEQFSQGMIYLAVESGIWGDISTSKPSANSCSGQIVRGVALMMKELLSGTYLGTCDSSHIQDNPLQQHAMSHSTEEFKICGAAKETTRLKKSVVISAPMWQDIPMVVPLFNKVCVLSSVKHGSVSKRSKTVSMHEWMQMCDQCSLTKLLPISRADCISAFLYSNKSIVSNDDIHELDLIEFCQSLIFLAAKSGILGNVDLSSLPSAGNCNDDVSRGVTLLLKEARMDQYVGMKPKDTDDLALAALEKKGTKSNRGSQQPGPVVAPIAFTNHRNAIANDNADDDPDDSYNSDMDCNETFDLDNGIAIDEDINHQETSDALHSVYKVEKKNIYNDQEDEVIIDDDDGETESCDTSSISSSDDEITYNRKLNPVETAPLWILEPDIRALFLRFSGGSARLPIKKLLQCCQAYSFKESLKLSNTQFIGLFKNKLNLGFDANEQLNSDHLSLEEFCQGLILISCKTWGSTRNGTNFPTARMCPKSVARSVVDILKRTNMLKSEKSRVDPHSEIDVAIPKLKIPLNISTWLSSEPAATHVLKVSPLFASKQKVPSKQKNFVDLYSGPSSMEKNILQRRYEAAAGSQSSRSAPVPPIQAKMGSHGARTARFVRKL
jgi:hypothetical protein